MAGTTNLSVTLNVDDVVDNLDKAAAKFENFAKQAGELMGKVDKATSGMSETQRRAYEVMKKSTNNHIQAMEKLSKEYEVLRNKQKNGIALTQQECAQLQVLTKQFKEHQGAIARNTTDLSKLLRSYDGVVSKLTDVSGLTQMAVAGIGGMVAAVFPKIGEFVCGAIDNIVSLGTQTQQTVAQFGAMANNLTNAAATYQAFNDVARNTNYDFEAVYNMGKQLLNMGFSAKNAADLIQQCADTAAGLGQDVSGAERLVATISRIQAAGKLTSKQLLELQMAGINLDDVFAPIGTSGEDAMQQLASGTMDSQKAMEALTEYMHQFDGKMNESKSNIVDMWGDVTGNIATACGEIGQGIADAFSKSEIVQDLIDFTQSMIDLVRGDGCGAFSDLGTVAQFVLDLIGDALQIVWSTIKLGIIWVNELYAAFKTMAIKVYNYLSWLLDPLSEIFSVVAKVTKAVGHEMKQGIDESFKQTFKPKVVVEDTGNHFRKPISVSSGSKGKSSGAGKGTTVAKLTEEERAVEALVKKYADAGKQAQTRGKLAIQTAALNAAMLIGETKRQEDLNNKLAGFRLNHDAVIEGYEKELALAQKIGDADIRQKTIAEINKQVEAQNALYAAQVKAASFEELQANSRRIIDNAFADPDSLGEKLKANKEKLASFMQEVNAIEAGGGSFNAAAMSQELTPDSMNFLQKMLKMTPDEIAADFEAKKEQFGNFAAYIQDAMAQATAAEAKNLSVGQQWADKQKAWLEDIGSSMGNAVTEWITGSKTIGQAMADMVKDLIKNAISLLARWSATWLTLVAFGSTPQAAAKGANKAVLGIEGKATGGYVSGPGTSTSDSIPTMLSNGEYVLNAAAVRRLGVPYLNSLNNGARGYADGGLVVPGYAASSGDVAAGRNGAGSSTAETSINLTVQTLDAESFAGALQRGGLGEAIKQYFMDNNRNFASEAGVW